MKGLDEAVNFMIWYSFISFMVCSIYIAIKSAHSEFEDDED